MKRKIDLTRMKRKYGLTDIEVDTVQLVCLGYSLKKVAEKSFREPSTIKSRLKQIYKKVGITKQAHCMRELVLLAQEEEFGSVILVHSNHAEGPNV